MVIQLECFVNCILVSLLSFLVIVGFLKVCPEFHGEYTQRWVHQENTVPSTDMCVCVGVFGPAFKARTRINFLHSK